MFGHPSRWLITKNDTGWKLREPAAPGSVTFDLSTHGAAVVLFDALTQAAVNG
ncbi:hypothetical protein JVX93_15845 [Mycolicibacterium boenickei]|nr:hypothetical protein JVX93_15845 [Mycolicibacterium boenickei]